MTRTLLIGAFTDDHADDSIDKTYLKKQFVSPPLGLHRIAQHLPFDVDVFDPNIQAARPFLDAHARDYDVIGCSLTHPTLENDLSLLWQAHRINPDALLLAGGEEAFFNAAQILEVGPPGLVCIQGEGEAPLGVLLGGIQKFPDESRPIRKFLDSSGFIYNVPGVITREGRGPFNSALPPDAFIEATVGMDFAEIPYPEYWRYMAAFFPDDSDETRRKTRTVRLFVSNHCPLKCTFCASTNFLTQDGSAPAKIAWVSADQLLDMIIGVVDAHPDVRTVFFHDDHFTIGQAGRDRAVELSHLIVEAKRRGHLPDELGFMAQCKITDVTPAMLEAMKVAGFWMMSYGVETLSQRQLDEFNKNCTVAEIERGLLANFAAGVVPFANIVLTSAHSTMRDVWETCVCCALLVDRGAEVGMNPYCMAFPGASMLNDPEVAAQVSTKRVRIPGTEISFYKTDRIMPQDERVCELLELAEDTVARIYDGSKIGSAQRSNMILQALFGAFETMEHRPFEAQRFWWMLNDATVKAENRQRCQVAA